MKIYIFTLFIVISFVGVAQLPVPTGPECIEVYEIMGFYDCENINDSVCQKITGTNGVLMRNMIGGYFRDLNSGQEWVYGRDIINLDAFIIPENDTISIKDTSEVVMPEIPEIRDYCGYIYENEDIDSIISYMVVSSWDTIKPINPEYENIGIKRTKEWTLINDRSIIPCDSILIKRSIDTISYDYVFYDCLDMRRVWNTTYIVEPNRTPIIFKNN